VYFEEEIVGQRRMWGNIPGEVSLEGTHFDT
jgi:hypothetical protein